MIYPLTSQVSLTLRSFIGFLSVVALLCLGGCAQRAHISPEFGVATQSVFYQQASTPAVQLAPTTAEDAKRISESRKERSGNKKSGRANRFGFANGGISGN